MRFVLAVAVTIASALSWSACNDPIPVPATVTLEFEGQVTELLAWSEGFSALLTPGDRVTGSVTFDFEPPPVFDAVAKPIVEGSYTLPVGETLLVFEGAGGTYGEPIQNTASFDFRGGEGPSTIFGESLYKLSGIYLEWKISHPNSALLCEYLELQASDFQQVELIGRVESGDGYSEGPMADVLLDSASFRLVELIRWDVDPGTLFWPHDPTSAATLTGSFSYDDATGDAVVVNLTTEAGYMVKCLAGCQDFEVLPNVPSYSYDAGLRLGDVFIAYDQLDASDGTIERMLSVGLVGECEPGTGVQETSIAEWFCNSGDCEFGAERAEEFFFRTGTGTISTNGSIAAALCPQSSMLLKLIVILKKRGEI